ncbi:MAG TPA: hypothetical protein VNC78_02125 [Actinomycetota bacterium]|nr:hypothetical protein [Actinomycetota bacterium]
MGPPVTTARRTLRVALVLALLASIGAAAPATGAPILPVSTNSGCDPIDPAACLLPFPNDYFTTPDESTATGRRVAFDILAMPRNAAEVSEGGEGKPVDPTEWNRNDGFSPGTPVITYVPEIDLHATWDTAERRHEGATNEIGYFDHRDHIADIGLYRRPDAPMVIVNAETGRRHPFWSELDTHPGAVGEQALILRPAVNFEEGTRYVVGLRSLKRSDGSIIEVGEAFAAFRDGNGADADRQKHFNDAVFPVLQGAGVARKDLFLAWDFTVASERNLSERMLHIRDDAFGRILGDTNLADGRVAGSSPEFIIDAHQNLTDTWTGSQGTEREQQYRVVEGRVTVPNYLDRPQQIESKVKYNELPYDPPVPLSRFFDADADGLPDQHPVESTVQVPFICHVPLNNRLNYGTLYGHGLLGKRDQIGDVKWPRRYGFFGCGVDWWGMSTDDVPTVAAIIADFSHFASLPDRAQQGFLNFMFLGRAMVHPQGFATAPQFKQGIKPLIRTASAKRTPLFFDGNSQGGIMGGSLVALSPDIERAILGVPAMNYSTLLQRSVDWEDLYAIPFYEIYRDPLERQIAFALMQMLWDRGEANGYAQHMTTDPLPNTPRHDVMLQVAFSDHQVTNHAAEVEANTIGAPVMRGLPPGRHWALRPFGERASYPYRGSALIYWDSGNATPPNGNIPADHDGDPHSHPRNEPAAGWQEAHFLLTGWMVDVCRGGPYLTLRHPDNKDKASCHPPRWRPGSRPR